MAQKSMRLDLSTTITTNCLCHSVAYLLMMIKIAMDDDVMMIMKNTTMMMMMMK